MARLLFIGLWCEADREGRMEYRPKRLQAAIFPYDHACAMDDLIMELEQKGFVKRYSVAGEAYLVVNNFSKHQQPHHKESKSVIPAPEQADSNAQGKHDSSMTQASGKQVAPCPTDSLIPDSLIPDSLVAPDKPAPTNAVWEAYSEAYATRYGEPPVRNAKSNGILKTFLSRIPAAEAPLVAAFYVRHPSAFYATKMHPLNVMLDDAEKLRTEWATNRTVTSTEARHQERTAANPFAQIAVQETLVRAIANGK